MAAKLKYLMFAFIFLSRFSAPLDAGQPSTQIKAIVFDFGSVIAKTDRQKISDYISQSFNISEEESAKALLGLKENRQNDGAEMDYWLKFAKLKKKKLPDDWLLRLNEVRFNALEEVPGMVNLVKCLKKQGYQTALLSNVRKSQAQIKRKLGFYDLFHPVLLSYETGFRKPDPKAYKLLLKKLNLPPEQVFFIDNKVENVTAAKSLGMDAIQFVSPEQLIEALKQRGLQCLPEPRP